MKTTDKEIQTKKAVKYSMIWMFLWGVKIFLVGGSPFLLLITSSVVFFIVYKKKS